jgi:hypothetical protein
MAIEAMMPMMATTISNSIKVKPFFFIIVSSRTSNCKRFQCQIREPARANQESKGRGRLTPGRAADR